MAETLSDAMVVEVNQKGDWKNERKKLDCPVSGSLRKKFGTRRQMMHDREDQKSPISLGALLEWDGPT
jgi:hypothetical protein